MSVEARRLKIEIGQYHEPTAIYGTPEALEYLQAVLAEANERIAVGGAFSSTLAKAASTEGGKIAAVSDEDFMHPKSGEAYGVLVVVQPADWWEGGGDET